MILCRVCGCFVSVCFSEVYDMPCEVYGVPCEVYDTFVRCVI